jgi:hypothetical protein
VRGFFPFSPAKEGPFKKSLRISGVKLVEDFAEGIRKGTDKAVAAVKDLVTKSVGRLDDLKSRSADVASSVADSVRSIVDIGALGTPFESTNALGDTISVTPNVKDQLAGFAAQAGQIAAAFAQAASKKIAPALLTALVSAGNLAGLQQLANASAADVASINSSFGQVDQFARQAGDQAVKITPLPAQIKREEQMLSELRQIRQAMRDGTVAEVKLKGDDLVVIVERVQRKNKRR